MSKKYVIISIEDVEDIDFNQVMQTDAKSLRISTDGKYTFVKFEGNTPSFLESKTQYTHEEFKIIIDDVDGNWTADDATQGTIIDNLRDTISGITWDKVNPFNWF